MRQRGGAGRLVGQAKERLEAWREDPTAPIWTTEPDRAEVVRRLNFALRAGGLMLQSGAGTVEVEQTILTLCKACGLTGSEVDVTFTSMSASYSRGDDREPITTIQVVRHRAVNYGQLAEVNEMRDELRTGKITPQQAMERLDVIERSRPRRGRNVVLGWAGMAAAFAVLLGGHEIVAITGFVSTACVYLVNRQLARVGVPDFFLSAIGAAIATGFAMVLASLHVAANTSLIVSSGIMVLVPGYALVAGLQDAITGFPISGGARSLEVALTGVGIASGVAIAIYISSSAGLHLQVSSGQPGTLVYLPVQIIAAAIAGILYAVATSVPRRLILPAGGAAAVGWAVYLGALHAHVSAVAASAIAAVVLGLGGQTLAGWYRTHPFIFIVPGLMPLVPGLEIYRGVLALVRHTGDGTTILFQAAAIAMVIAAGVVLGNLLINPLRRPRSRHHHY